jgi:hypothetical protein
LDFSLPLQFLLLTVGNRIATRVLSFGEQLLDRIGRASFQHRIWAEPLCDLALDALGTSVRVDVNLQPVKGNLDGPDRGVVPVLV